MLQSPFRLLTYGGSLNNVGFTKIHHHHPQVITISMSVGLKPSPDGMAVYGSQGCPEYVVDLSTTIVDLVINHSQVCSNMFKP